MWWHYTLGNVKERPLRRSGSDTADPLMAGPKRYPGRSKALRHLRLSAHLQRQHPCAGAADHRRRLGRRPVVISTTRKSRRENQDTGGGGVRCPFLRRPWRRWPQPQSLLRAPPPSPAALCRLPRADRHYGASQAPPSCPRTTWPACASAEAEKVIRRGRLATRCRPSATSFRPTIKARSISAYTPVWPRPGARPRSGLPAAVPTPPAAFRKARLRCRSDDSSSSSNPATTTFPSSTATNSEPIHCFPRAASAPARWTKMAPRPTGATSFASRRRLD